MKEKDCGREVEIKSENIAIIRKKNLLNYCESQILKTAGKILFPKYANVHRFLLLDLYAIEFQNSISMDVYGELIELSIILLWTKAMRLSLNKKYAL